MLNSGSNIYSKVVINILIIRLSSIGDIILTTGIIEYIKKKYPNSNIYYLTDRTFVSLLEANPNIYRVIPYNKTLNFQEQKLFKSLLLQELKRDEGLNHFDITIDLHNNFRSRIFRKGISLTVYKVAKHRLRKLSLVHFKPLYNLLYKNTEQEYHTIKNYFSAIKRLPNSTSTTANEFSDFYHTYLYLKAKNILKSEEVTYLNNSIIIAPGAKHFTKRYPITKMVELCKKILTKFNHTNLVFIGGQEDQIISNSIIQAILSTESGNFDKGFDKNRIKDYTGKTDLATSAEIIKQANLIICNDSGTMHLASSTDTPIIAIFGSTTTNLGFSPIAKKFKIIEVDLDCRPCTHIGRSSCPLVHFNCMNLIDNDKIIQSIQELIE